MVCAGFNNLYEIISLRRNNMYDKFRTWMYINSVQVTWFLIGLFTAFGIDALGTGNLVGAVINFGLAGLNYALRKI
jgi:hypothetical protein